MTDRARAEQAAKNIMAIPQLHAAFQLEWLSPSGERMFPMHFLAFLNNGIVEPHSGERPVLTPFGQQVAAAIRSQDHG